MAGQIINRGKNKWLVRVYLGEDQEGKRQYHNKTIEGTKKEAQAYLNSKLVEKYTTGTVLQPSTQALGKYLDEWLETSAKPRLRERTLSSYENVLNLYIRPELGYIKLCELSPVKIQSTYNKLAERVSARTVRYAHAVLRSALNQAVKWQLLPKNPALLVDLPRQKKAEVSVLTPEQAKVFLEAAKENRWYSLFSLMLNAGTRPGEALGLKWSDIDFKNDKIYIQRALVRRTGGGWELDETKTTNSRVIPLPSSVMDVMRDHKKHQAEEKMKKRKNYKDLRSEKDILPESIKDKKFYYDFGFVFASENGHPLDERNVVNRYFKPLLKEAELRDIRLYDLRHTCATLLLLAGENPKVVSERLGHASIVMTLDTYSHVLPDMQQGAADKLEKLLYQN